MNIGILGIGLIGASLARDFSAAGSGTIHVYDNNPEHMAIARHLGLGHVWHNDMASFATACDLIFLCVPVRSIGTVAGLAAPHMRRGTILTDVGSVKAPVVAAVRDVIPEGTIFVPGHPAAGLEYSGPAAGIQGLFAGKAWVLTPDDRTDPGAVSAVQIAISSATGARVLRLDATTHDRIFAYTSHMAHILAFAAMNATPKISAELGENILPYAGTSYRDLTRVANADKIMWRDIFLTNTDAIEHSLDAYIAEIMHLRSMVKSRDEADLTAYIESSAALRADMDSQYGAPGPSVPTPMPVKK